MTNLPPIYDHANIFARRQTTTPVRCGEYLVSRNGGAIAITPIRDLPRISAEDARELGKAMQRVVRVDYGLFIFDPVLWARWADSEFRPTFEDILDATYIMAAVGHPLADAACVAVRVVRGTSLADMVEDIENMCTSWPELGAAMAEILDMRQIVDPESYDSEPYDPPEGQHYWTCDHTYDYMRGAV